MTARTLPHLEEDDRLLPMLSSLSKRYLGEDYSKKKVTAGQVTADMLDMVKHQLLIWIKKSRLGSKFDCVILYLFWNNFL